MSKVLLDNLGLADGFYKLLGDKRGFSHYNWSRKEIEDICWQNFLTSIILWDDVYLNFDFRGNEISSFEMLNGNYPDYVLLRDGVDEYFGSKEFSTRLVEYVIPFQNLLSQYINKYDFFHTLDPKQSKNAIVKSAATAEKIRHGLRLCDELGPEYNNMLLRAYDYVIDANFLGYNYIPHPYRAKILKDFGIFGNKFNRQVYFDILDNSIDKYLYEGNELLGEQLFTTEFPVLYNFISKHANTPEQELDVAIALRDDRDVIKFRKSINEIEKALEKGDKISLINSLNETNEICKTITKVMNNIPVSVGVSLGLTPSLELGVGFEATLSGDIKYKRNGFVKLHTTFLYDIADFALRGDYNHIYDI